MGLEVEKWKIQYIGDATPSISISSIGWRRGSIVKGIGSTKEVSIDLKEV